MSGETRSNDRKRQPRWKAWLSASPNKSEHHSTSLDITRHHSTSLKHFHGCILPIQKGQHMMAVWQQRVQSNSGSHPAHALTAAFRQWRLYERLFSMLFS